MKKYYTQMEWIFERLATIFIAVLGNSITFVIALGVVIFWLFNKQFYSQGIHDALRDVISGISFLCLFLLQKAFNRFTASMHLKVNELVTSHEPARNEVIHLEDKSEREIKELTKEFSDQALQETEDQKNQQASLS
jgi:low affinity Fe/Cu permease